MIIRAATLNDVANICAIYSDAVLNGVASFEEHPPTQIEIRQRMTTLLDGGFPYIVAEDDKRVVGYAYAGAFRPRSAYRFTLEDSIYIAPDCQGRGVGKSLLVDLIEKSKTLGFHSIMASVGGASPASIRVHASCGFKVVGTVKHAGFKFGQWQDLVYMQIMLD